MGQELADNIVKVMVVDDSAVIRGFLSRFIESDPGIRVVSSASNGQIALDNMKTHTYDVVVLDIEMPVMDGLTALPEIIKADPCVQVVIASTLSKANAAVTLKAFQMGAAECLAKPTSDEISGSTMFRDSLVDKVKHLGALAKRKRARKEGKSSPSVETATGSAPAAQPDARFTLRTDPVKRKPNVLAIGSSTGGPQALIKFFTDLKDPVAQPIFITQHMPPTFTTILSEHISKYSGLNCIEVDDGIEVQPGGVYLARGGRHMLVKVEGGKKIIRLDDGPAENFCKPAVDPMLRSIIAAYGANSILTVILTGMGSDGLKACQQLVEGGGHVIAQDSESSVVWGMPGAVATAGICSNVLPLDKLANEVKTYLNSGV